MSPRLVRWSDDPVSIRALPSSASLLAPGGATNPELAEIIGAVEAFGIVRTGTLGRAN
jgi:hypothetical protein